MGYEASDNLSVNGSNGKDPSTGRFLPGWKGGPGNPHAKKVHQLRSALIEAVTTDNIRNIITKLIEQAEAGDTVSAREVLDRVLGKPTQAVVTQDEEGNQHQIIVIPSPVVKHMRELSADETAQRA